MKLINSPLDYKEETCAYCNRIVLIPPGLKTTCFWCKLCCKNGGFSYKAQFHKEVVKDYEL